MKRLLASALCSLAVAGCVIDEPPQQNAQRLITGKNIPATMPAVRQAVGSLPMNVIVSPDKRYAIVSDMGYRQSLSAIDLSTGKRVGEIVYATTKKNPTVGLYYGLAIDSENNIYAAQGGEASVAVVHLEANGTLVPVRTIKLTGGGDFPAGVALDGRGNLFITSNAPSGNERPLHTPGVLFAYRTDGEFLGRYDFPSFMGTTNYPLDVVALKDGSKVYVASQRDGCVYAFDAKNPKDLKPLGKIETGAHPSDLLLDESHHRLLVSNADSDTVAIVNTNTDKITATVLLRPEIAQNVAGVSPLGMSLSSGARTLYVATADLNAVAVLDVDPEKNGHELLGYIPAGWYPSAVATDGKKLLIVDAKGTTTRYPNPPAEKPEGSKKPDGKMPAHMSPNNLVEGDTLLRDLPNPKDLQASTQQVLDLARLTPHFLRRENPLANLGVKHVIYIVKENRTYDQVLGDLPQGNGDPSRCIFGRNVTPNLHALAERFVLLDNFFDCGEVSGDGWTWSTQAMANEYVIKNVPYQYSNRGRVFDYEGVNNEYPTGGFPGKDSDGKTLSEIPGLQNGAAAVPDVAAGPGGHLWDLCKAHNVGFRNYGFFVGGAARSKDKKKITPDNYPSVAALQPPGHDLAGVTDYDYRRFDLDYADSEAPQKLYEQTNNKDLLRPVKTFGKHAAPSRIAEWKTEFAQMLAKDPSGGAVPQMMFVRLGDDHTKGMSSAMHTPASMVADNDYACGELVETISHSPIWKDTAIFIIEDDAQNGPDHVDAHRSVCYVASPWVKKSTVDHTFHNTVSCIRTMECLLHLPPMNSYDAVADPMAFFDSRPSNAEPFDAILPDAKLIAAKNPGGNKIDNVSPESRRLIDESDEMNFAVADKAPADELNQIIWASVMGPHSQLPPTPRGPTPLHAMAKDEDDD